MEITPTIFIAALAVILTIISLIVAATAWLIRLESKTTNHAADIEELYKHAEDKEIHSDKAALDLRFATLSTAIADVKHLVERLDERLRRFLEK